MNQLWNRPQIAQVQIDDTFWTPYLSGIRNIMLPYTFAKFEETGYVENFRSAAAKDGRKHVGPPFSDGLLLESMRGAFDFLAACYDPQLDARMDKLVDIVCAAADDDGFLCTQTQQDYPDKRWGENGGDIIIQHDLYDHGALVEAAVSQYLATGKTKLLACAVKAANLICAYIGEPPKHNVIPGHSLPEEAFVKLYRLFRDHRELDAFAADHQVQYADYLEIARFWYDNRGNHENRSLSDRFKPFYNQDHLPFARQTTAEGHSVRATLCYAGAAAVARELGRDDYVCALEKLWDNVANRKMHISGGVGTRHDIEGFDTDYNLPNDAYLETCAAIGLAFWNGEMALLNADAKYFDIFERALYNNILASIGQDFTHYFYQNPLVSDGSIRRWDWHICPCCPPMLLKIYGALGSYIYACRDDALCVNMFIGSCLKTENYTIRQQKNTLFADSHGRELELRIRMPEYVRNFALTHAGQPLAFTEKNGYAVVRGVWREDQPICISFINDLRRVCANPQVEADRGLVCVMHGPYVLCAESTDNDGRVDFTIASAPDLTLAGDEVIGKTADGNTFRLIPYYRWCNRNTESEAAKMAVWFPQEDMLSGDALAQAMDNRLYANYDLL